MILKLDLSSVGLETHISFVIQSNAHLSNQWDLWKLNYFETLKIAYCIWRKWFRDELELKYFIRKKKSKCYTLRGENKITFTHRTSHYRLILSANFSNLGGGGGGEGRGVEGVERRYSTHFKIWKYHRKRVYWNCILKMVVTRRN